MEGIVEAVFIVAGILLMRMIIKGLIEEEENEY